MVEDTPATEQVTNNKKGGDEKIVAAPDERIETNDETATNPKEDCGIICSVREHKPRVLPGKLLNMVLRNCAPLNVIQTMLQINPNAAKVPDSGPSALQIALRHSAPVEVVKEIIQACPYALFVGNGTYDPLTYAKIWRGDEDELIKLLQRPISHWLKPSHESRKVMSTHKRAVSMVEMSGLGSSDRKELLNIKLITSVMMKAQKKQIVKNTKKQEKVNAEIKDLQYHAQLARIKSREFTSVLTHEFDKQVSSLCNIVSEAVGIVNSKQDRILEEIKLVEHKHDSEITAHRCPSCAKEDKIEEKIVSRMEAVLSSYESLLEELKTGVLQANSAKSNKGFTDHSAVTHCFVDFSPFYYPTLEPDDNETDPLIARNISKKKKHWVIRCLCSAPCLFPQQRKVARRQK